MLPEIRVLGLYNSIANHENICSFQFRQGEVGTSDSQNKIKVSPFHEYPSWISWTFLPYFSCTQIQNFILRTKLFHEIFKNSVLFWSSSIAFSMEIQPSTLITKPNQESWRVLSWAFSHESKSLEPSAPFISINPNLLPGAAGPTLSWAPFPVNIQIRRRSVLTEFELLQQGVEFKP